MMAMLVLVRLVPVAQVGQVVFAQATASLVMLVVDLRFEDAVQRYFPQMAARSHEEAVALFWRLIRWDACFGLTVAGIATLAWSIGILPESHIARPLFFTLALVAAGVASAVGTLNAGFAVTDGLTSLGRVALALAAANAALTMVGAMLLGGLGFLIGNLAGSVLQVLVLFALCRRRLPSVTVNPKVSPLPPGLGRFLMSSSVSTSLAVGSDNGVLAIAGIGGGPILVALLRVAQAPGRLFLSIFSPLAVQAFPRLSKMAAGSDQDAMIQLTNRTTKLVLGAGSFVVMAGILLMAPAIEILYGPQYKSATNAGILLLLAGVLRASISWAKVLPLAVGRPTLRLFVLLTESAITLAGTALIVKFVHDAPLAVTAIAAVSVFVSAVLLLFWLRISHWRGLLGPRTSLWSAPTKPSVPSQPPAQEG
jgi:O-antigen/teichoic acid export membrane protein